MSKRNRKGQRYGEMYDRVLVAIGRNPSDRPWDMRVFNLLVFHRERCCGWARPHKVADRKFVGLLVTNRCQGKPIYRDVHDKVYCLRHLLENSPALPRDVNAEMLSMRPSPTSPYSRSFRGEKDGPWMTQREVEAAGVDREELWRRVHNCEVAIFSTHHNGLEFWRYSKAGVERVLEARAQEAERRLA